MYEFNTKNQRCNGRDEYVAEHEDIKKSDRVNSAGRAYYMKLNSWRIDKRDRVAFSAKKEAAAQKLSAK